MIDNTKKLIKKAFGSVQLRDAILMNVNVNEAVVALEEEVDRLTAHKNAMEHEYRLTSAEAYSSSDDTTLAKARDAAAVRLADATTDLDNATATLAGMKIRAHESATEKARAERKAKAERATEIMGEVTREFQAADTSLTGFLKHFEAGMQARGGLASVVGDYAVAQSISFQELKAIFEQRATALGYSPKFKYLNSEPPRLVDVIPDAARILELAGLDK